MQSITKFRRSQDLGLVASYINNEQIIPKFMAQYKRVMRERQTKIDETIRLYVEEIFSAV